MKRLLTTPLLMLGVLATASPVAAADRALSPREQVEFFAQKVRPLLVKNCFKCHGGAKAKGGLHLDSRAAIMRGGDSGRAVNLKRPAKSLLLEAINYELEGYEMPPTGKLAPDQIAILTRWIRMGLPITPDFAGRVGRNTAIRSPQVNAETKSFWSFQPVRRPKPPAVRNARWVRGPIDRFLLARLEAAGLAPAPPARRTALLRRATYDLTGLPPTPGDTDAFLADDSPKAFEKVVDRLLESPHYGEQWGRHWLDLVRYAESNSYERDGAKPFVWRYRDYVIRSFNDDKPFDRFATEQLAGDELEAKTAEGIIATGYYRLGIWQDEPVDREQSRFEDLDDILRTTTEVFLGLTVGCARCHDHKLDPIPQRDYYRLLAFFRNIRRYGVRGGNTVLAASVGKIGDLQALRVKELGPSVPQSYIQIRGNAHARGEPVEPGFPLVLSPPPPAIRPPAKGQQSSNRRMALAGWITSPTNPLTARVLANRLWQYHFGRGIVRSSNNFGLKGQPPTHPQLLDWLAAELVEGGWTLKRMHRQIMLSSAYRMSSVANRRGLATDPINNLFWRFDMRRLSAEEVRDSVLAVNGALNRGKMFGPSIYTIIPREVLQGQSQPGAGWGKSSPEDRNRRSIYIHVKRSLVVPLFETFDGPDLDSSCPVRFTTTQPTQSLALLNGQFSNREANVFAAYLKKQVGNDRPAQVRLALKRSMQRPPTDKEVERGVALIQALEAQDTKPAKPAKPNKRAGATTGGDLALKTFCLLTFNLNEFLYLD